MTAPVATAAEPIVPEAGQLGRLAEWAGALELSDVPERVVSFAASHLLSQLAAIRTGLAQEDGRRLTRALGAPFQADTAQSARVLAGAGAWLNLDDTAYAGHLGPSTVGVPLAYAHALGLSGAELLRAVILADECAARVTAAATLGPFRGQTALHTHLVGAVAGRLACERASARQWRDALALALSAPPWTLMRGFIDSDARMLHVPVAVRMGLDACDAAEGGLRGADDIIEHPDGFLAQFAAVPLPEAVTMGSAGAGTPRPSPSSSTRAGPASTPPSTAHSISIRRWAVGPSTTWPRWSWNARSTPSSRPARPSPISTGPAPRSAPWCSPLRTPWPPRC